MISPGLALEISRDILRFRGEIVSFFLDLSSEYTLDVGREINAMSTTSTASKGVLGGVFHDLTRSPSNLRRDVMLISAGTFKLMSAFDDFVDGSQLPPCEKERAAEQTVNLLKTGNIPPTDDHQLMALFALASNLHMRISQTPFPFKYYDEFDALAESFRQDLLYPPSLPSIAEFGARAMSIGAVVPYCFTSGLDGKFLYAAKKFGAYVNILDDVLDYRIDKTSRTTTIMTISTDPDQMRKEAMEYARGLYEDCLSQLNQHEQRVYETLRFLFHLKWFAETRFGYFSR